MEPPRIAAFTSALLAGFAACAGAEAGETFRGPVEASVLRVLDGDTFLAEAHVWPGHSVTVNIRIRGIDAPERKARCAAERRAAAAARLHLEGLIQGRVVAISNIAGAKYYGRVLADVEAPDVGPVATLMLDAGLVRRYGGGRRMPWCG